MNPSTIPFRKCRELEVLLLIHVDLIFLKLADAPEWSLFPAEALPIDPGVAAHSAAGLSRGAATRRYVRVTLRYRPSQITTAHPVPSLSCFCCVESLPGCCGGEDTLPLPLWKVFRASVSHLISGVTRFFSLIRGLEMERAPYYDQNPPFVRRQAVHAC